MFIKEPEPKDEAQYKPVDHVDAKSGGRKPAQFSGQPLSPCGFHVAKKREHSGGIKNAEGSEIPFEVRVHGAKPCGHDPGAEEMHAESCNTEDIDPGSLRLGERMPVQPPAYENKEHKTAHSLDSESKVPFDAAKLGSEGQEGIDKEGSCNAVAEDRLPAFIGNGGENGNGEVDGKQRDEEPEVVIVSGVDEIGDDFGDCGMLDLTSEHEVDHDKDGPAEERDHRFAESVSEEFPGSVAGSVFHEGDAADHEKDRNGEVGQAFDEVGADPPGFGAVGPEYAVHVEVNDGKGGDGAEVEDVGLLFGLHWYVTPGKSVRQNTKAGNNKTVFYGLLYTFPTVIRKKLLMDSKSLALYS